jgi:putative two-component system response regulator
MVENWQAIEIEGDGSVVPRKGIQNARILVVDDDRQNRVFLKRILQPMGFRVREATNGEEALADVAAELPDIILLDVMMPKLDGYEVCQKLKTDPRTRLIPIIMLTSLGQLSDKLKGVELGVDDFLTKPFNIAELMTRVRSLLSLKQYTDDLEHASNVLESIAMTVAERDAYTSGHCIRVGHYAVAVGERFGLGEEDLKVLRLAGTFHDLGKIAVPDGILRKPGPLTLEERNQMQSHAAKGADLVTPMRTMGGVLPLIRHHHERMDGSGYPAGLSGNEISLMVRIITVVDIYDALGTERPYKDALSRERSLEILREEAERGWWDRRVIETLAQITESPENQPPSP